MVNQPTQPQLLLGRYRAIEERDRGGFGAVLVCWDVRLQRRVAIKCLPLDVDEGATAAIHEALAEARASSNLTHPNIVTIHDFEVDEQFAYLVMEYVDGLTLAELIARVEGGVLVYDEVANVLDSVASALAYAHENGVLHLDIKPGNVMIDRSGAVKLGDFGMATLMSAAGWGGARGGTVGYMPPEQLTGELVDERTDVFALATVCYEALTGVSPFAASTAAQSLKLIAKGPAPLSDKEPELAGPVELAFMSALSPSPAGRMSSPEEFAGEVLPSLGDPRDGKASLAQLINDEPSAQDDFDESPWRAMDPPGRRAPWVAPACTRAANGLACALLAWHCAPAVGLSSLVLQGAAVLVAGGAAALWAPAGAAVASGLLVLAVVTPDVTPVSVFAAVAVGGLAGLWLGRASTSSRLSAASLLAAPALGWTTFTPGLAGYAFAPARAAATGALACFLALVAELLATAHSSLDAPAFSQGFLNLLSNPGNWALLAGAALGAAACSRIGSSGAPDSQASRVRALIGQVVAFILLGCGIAVRAALENDGIVSSGSGGAWAVAVGSLVLMTVVVGLFGAPERDWEEG